ncbi:beta-lactamase family protein [Deefgea tanakiae]|uniref:Beta-lactamase family protein n=1 Tax=Deefgea tanakiae TaxID=2865840 RepID=A0ABX8ZD93_9NEIS|nr:serine hydrolase [Deefgea tanakiae]QZA78844.1 beta-lactamase family protein [Deefgea tanakiae]
MQRHLISVVIAFSLSSVFASDLSSSPKVQNQALAQFKTATPESVGLDSAQLTKMLSYLQTPGFDMESIIIARHGKVVLEAYVAPFHAGIPHQVNSVTKSFMATLIGMLISDGKLKLTDTVADILPQYADLPNAKLITVEQLLGMKTGLLWKDSGEGTDWLMVKQQSDWVDAFLKLPIEADLTGSYNYNSGGSDLLGILGEATLGSSLADYADQRLFKPLGITKTRWVNLDQQGHIGGGRGLYIMPRDMLKLGELYRQNGAWQGKQILPASWVQYATSPMVNAWAETHYGAQWWVEKNREWYSALGARGQFIAVFPKDDIIVVMTSRNQDRSDFGLSALREYYLKIKDPRDENPIAFAALQDKITQLATPTATSKLRSPLEKTINKRKIDLENTTFWGNQLTFEFNDDVATITMSPRSIGLGDQPFIIQANLGDTWLHTPVKPVDNRWQKSGPESMRAARAQWLDNNTLQFEAMDVDESYSVNYKIKFKGKKATLLNMNDSVASQGSLR